MPLVTDWSRAPWFLSSDLPPDPQVTHLRYTDGVTDWIAPLGTPAPEGFEDAVITTREPRAGESAFVSMMLWPAKDDAERSAVEQMHRMLDQHPNGAWTLGPTVYRSGRAWTWFGIFAEEAITCSCDGFRQIDPDEDADLCWCSHYQSEHRGSRCTGER